MLLAGSCNGALDAGVGSVVSGACESADAWVLSDVVFIFVCVISGILCTAPEVSFFLVLLMQG